MQREIRLLLFRAMTLNAVLFQERHARLCKLRRIRERAAREEERRGSSDGNAVFRHPATLNSREREIHLPFEGVHAADEHGEHVAELVALPRFAAEELHLRGVELEEILAE